jgi:hypothetical protein
MTKRRVKGKKERKMRNADQRREERKKWQIKERMKKKLK